MPFTPFNPCFSRPKCKPDKCKCSKGGKLDKHGSYLKFSGLLSTASEAPLSYYLGDAGPVALSPTIVIAYPVARRGRLKDLAVNIAPPGVVPNDGAITVQLLRNGVAVAGFLLAWGPGETLGLKTLKTDELRVSRGDLLALRVNVASVEAAGNPLAVTATVGVV